MGVSGVDFVNTRVGKHKSPHVVATLSTRVRGQGEAERRPSCFRRPALFAASLFARKARSLSQPVVTGGGGWHGGGRIFLRSFFYLLFFVLVGATLGVPSLGFLHESRHDGPRVPPKARQSNISRR